MSPLTRTEQLIVDTIRQHRRAAPIIGRDIIARFNLEPTEAKRKGAKLRAYINEIRAKGYPICASGDGYFWPSNGQDILDQVESLEGRASLIIRAADGMRAGMRIFQDGVAAEK